jgi:hypothetical protein
VPSRFAEGTTSPEQWQTWFPGRDSDSIATMAGALCGAIGGIDAVPAEWRATVATNSRLDLAATGRTMAGVAADVFAKDQARAEERAAVFAALHATTPGK